MAKPEPTHFSERLPVRLIRRLNNLYIRGFHDVRIMRPPGHIPATGPLVLVANHLSSLDPFLIQACFPRLIHWMMAREYYDLPVARRLLDLIEVIPVDREKRDSTATRAALRLLQSGKVLGIFPEGTFLNLPDEEYTRLYPGSPPLLEFHPGAATLACRANAPIVPVAISGTMANRSIVEPLLYPMSASISFGDILSRGGQVDTVNDAMVIAIRQQLESQQ